MSILMSHKASTIWHCCTKVKEATLGEAEPLYRQALQMRQRLLGDEHPDVGNKASTIWHCCTKVRDGTQKRNPSIAKHFK